jgi:hypothetical protein
VFTISTTGVDVDVERAQLKSLLAKFRIDVIDVIVLSINEEKLHPDTYVDCFLCKNTYLLFYRKQIFEDCIAPFRDISTKDGKSPTTSNNPQENVGVILLFNSK